MAPDVGFEPTTKWLTATYSTAELIRNKNAIIIEIQTKVNIFVWIFAFKMTKWIETYIFHYFDGLVLFLNDLWLLNHSYLYDLDLHLILVEFLKL